MKLLNIVLKLILEPLQNKIKISNSLNLCKKVLKTGKKVKNKMKNIRNKPKI